MSEAAIPIIDVPENPAYSKVDLEDLIKEGWQYYDIGRLTLDRLSYAISALMNKWYRKRKDFQIQVQLVIPPELIFTILYMFREDNLENFVTYLIDKVWIDINIEAAWPNCPWYLLASPDFIIGDETNLEGMYYSAGIAP